MTEYCKMCERVASFDVGATPLSGFLEFARACLETANTYGEDNTIVYWVTDSEAGKTTGICNYFRDPTEEEIASGDARLVNDATTQSDVKSSLPPIDTLFGMIDDYLTDLLNPSTRH